MGRVLYLSVVLLDSCCRSRDAEGHKKSQSNDEREKGKKEIGILESLGRNLREGTEGSLGPQSH